MQAAPLSGLTDEPRLRDERARLVRLCYRWTGNVDAAEDLAQEALWEALRNAHKLRDPSGASAWLAAVARHVCARWNERRGRELKRLRQFDDGREMPDDDSEGLDIAEEYDLDVELDRRELATLLDRALALLPPESRDVLIAHYVRESPHTAIAARLGLTGPAVAKRLERGRLRLKHVLATRLIHEASSYGLASRMFDDWEETPLWCPCCGRRHLLGKRMPDGRLWLICRPCIIPVNLYVTVPTRRGVRGYAATYACDAAAHDRRFAGGIAGQQGRCYGCGALLPFRVIGWSYPFAMHYAAVWCPTCRDSSLQFGAHWQLLASPEGRRFQQEHPRLRLLPDREVEAAGVPAIVASAESMTSRARLEGVFGRDTFQRIGVRVTGGA